MFSLLTSFIPTTLISSVISFLTPLLNSFMLFLNWYLTEMIDGIKTILSNFSTLVVIGTIMIISVLYGTSLATCSEIGPLIPEIIDKPWEFDFGVR